MVGVITTPSKVDRKYIRIVSIRFSSISWAMMRMRASTSWRTLYHSQSWRRRFSSESVVLRRRYPARVWAKREESNLLPTSLYWPLLHPSETIAMIYFSSRIHRRWSWLFRPNFVCRVPITDPPAMSKRCKFFICLFFWLVLLMNLYRLQ